MAKKRGEEMEAQRDGKCIGEIRPGGIDYTVGKVEEFDCSVDNGKAQGNEGIDAACDNTA